MKFLLVPLGERQRSYLQCARETGFWRPRRQRPCGTSRQAGFSLCADVLGINRARQVRLVGSFDDGPAVGKQGKLEHSTLAVALGAELTAQEEGVAGEVSVGSKARC